MIKRNKLRSLLNDLQIGIIGKKKWVRLRYYCGLEKILQKFVEEGLIFGYSIRQRECIVQFNITISGKNVITNIHVIPSKSVISLKLKNLRKLCRLTVLLFFYEGRNFYTDQNILNWKKKKKTGILFCLVY
jgi:hypothetical protein